jgi:hypothetical protein
MIRGKNNPTYLRFITRLRQLAPELFPSEVTPSQNSTTTTEVVLRSDQLRQFQRVLLDAFPRPSELAQMISYELDENPEVIAGGEQLTDRVFNLLTWAGAHDKYAALLAAAYKANPDNIALRKIAFEFGISDV